MNPRGVEKSPRWLKIGIYCIPVLLPFVLFYWTVPLVVDTSIGKDYQVFPISQQQSLQHSLAHGTWPMFVPGFAGGRPAAALTLGQFFHPQSHIAAALPGYWSGHATHWNTLFRLLTLGGCHLAFLILFRRLRLGWIGAFVASLVAVYNLRLLDNFRYGASLENHTGHLLLIASAAFLYLKPTRVLGPLCVAISVYLTVCGGHPQMMYFGLFGGGVMVLVMPFLLRAICEDVPWDRGTVLGYYKWLVIAGVTGLVLSAAYIVPLYFDFVAQAGERAAQTYKWSLGFHDDMGGVLNNLFNPMNSNLAGAFGTSAFFLVALLAPLVVALRVKTRLVIFFLWAFALFVYTLSFGEEFPIHYFWWKYFPLAGTFRVPGRTAMMLLAPAAFLVAWLLSRPDFEFRIGKLPVRWSPIGAVAFMALASYLAYNLHFHASFDQPTYLTPVHIRDVANWVPDGVMWLGAASLLVLVLPTFSKGMWQRRVMRGLVLLVLLAQTGIVMWNGTWVVPYRNTKSVEALDNRMRSRLAFHAHPGNGMRSDKVRAQMSTSFLATEQMGKFFRNYVEVAPQKAFYKQSAYLRTEDNVVVARTDRQESMSGARASKDQEDSVKSVYTSFNRVVFEVNNHEAGYFNFTYPDHEYWRGFVDGKEAPLYRANGSESALFLESGTHRVELKFFSSASFIGVIISLCGLAALLFYASWFLKRRARIAAMVGALGIPVLLGFLWMGALYDGDNLNTKYNWTTRKLPRTEGNLAFGKPTATSTLKKNQYPFRFYSGLGVDGQKNGNFCTSKNRTRHWWKVDLGEKKRIKEVVLYDNSSQTTRRLLPLRLEAAANSNQAYKLVKTLKERGKGRAWRIPVDVSARFIRIKTKTKEKGSMCFKEVELYAEPTQPQREEAPSESADSTESSVPGIQYPTVKNSQKR